MNKIERPLNTFVKVSIASGDQANEYTIPMPKAGQLIDIEQMKAAFSNGNYDQMTKSRGVSSKLSVGFIDAIATFSIMIPDLRKNLNVETLFDLNIESMLSVVAAYKTYAKWWAQWEEYFEQIGKDNE